MIYMDNAATAPVDPDVFKAMEPFFMEQYGNPSSLHSLGRKARIAVGEARLQCAKALSCHPDQIHFTSGSTESNNWAMDMMFMYLDDKWLTDQEAEPPRVYVSQIEHKSVFNMPHNVALPVSPEGIIDLRMFYDLVEDRPNHNKGIAIQWVNSEIGTIQPVEELADFCYKHQVMLHIDATQAVGKIPIDLTRIHGITTLALSGHKIGGAKGCGILFVRDPDKASQFLRGGKQEHGLRAGTENVPGIVGLGAAMKNISERTYDEWLQLDADISGMHSLLYAKLSTIPDVRFNGKCSQQLPHYLNASFKGILGEALALALDRRGICVSTGSACNTGSLEPSYVLKAIGVPDDYIEGTIRISLSEHNTPEECRIVAEAIKEEVAKLRSVSPTWKGE